MNWLSDAFGFTVQEVIEVEGVVVHAQMGFRGSHFYISLDRADDKYALHSPMALNGTNQCVCVVLPDGVDAACERARAAGGDIVTEPYDTPFGSRDFVCKDPEGHVWTFGTYSGAS